MKSERKHQDSEGGEKRASYSHDHGGKDPAERGRWCPQCFRKNKMPLAPLPENRGPSLTAEVTAILATVTVVLTHTSKGQRVDSEVHDDIIACDPTAGGFLDHSFDELKNRPKAPRSERMSCHPMSLSALPVGSKDMHPGFVCWCRFLSLRRHKIHAKNY